MRVTASELHECHVQARDGTLGRVQDVYFDDGTWTVRYLVVETGGWLHRRRVLISPLLVRQVDLARRTCAVDLTRAEVAGSPDIDSALPISRQLEMRYRDYFRWPAYWAAGFYEPQVPPVWQGAAREAGERARQMIRHERTMSAQSGAANHLRSAAAVAHHKVVADDGEVGHVADFVIDARTWHITHLVVDTRNWIPGRKVELPIAAVRRLSWTLSTVRVAMSRAQVATLPEHGRAPAKA
ncbi:MAG TPA: PRC-barrel domain-containing protein [Dehalococcoidia bacterium]|nr:PRC-barrel domain-containing protein [Dehalococcoidia bacterium]